MLIYLNICQARIDALKVVQDLLFYLKGSITRPRNISSLWKVTIVFTEKSDFVSADFPLSHLGVISLIC